MPPFCGLVHTMMVNIWQNIKTCLSIDTTVFVLAKCRGKPIMSPDFLQLQGQAMPHYTVIKPANYYNI